MKEKIQSQIMSIVEVVHVSPVNSLLHYVLVT
jgi:hypothetical protein